MFLSHHDTVTPCSYDVMSPPAYSRKVTPHIFELPGLWLHLFPPPTFIRHITGCSWFWVTSLFLKFSIVFLAVVRTLVCHASMLYAIVLHYQHNTIWHHNPMTPLSWCNNAMMSWHHDAISGSISLSLSESPIYPVSVWYMLHQAMKHYSWMDNV